MVDCADWVRCISVERTLASRSLLDPNKAAGPGGQVLFPPGEMETKQKRHQKFVSLITV